MFEPIEDLIAEQVQVDKLVSGFRGEDWKQHASFCTTWTFKDVIAHVALFDYCAVELINGRGETVGEVGQAYSGRDEHFKLDVWQNRTGEEALSWWREQRTLMVAELIRSDPKARIPWAPGLPMSTRSLCSARLMELWAHSVDIYDALSIEPVVEDRIASTLFLSWQGRPNQYRINGFETPDTPMYLELVLPSGALWAKGDSQAENRIIGKAKDWALVSIRRRNWRDTDLEITGDEARRYASIVQTYAGEAEACPPAKRQR